MSHSALEDSETEIPPFPVRRWSVDEYLLFARMGILDEDDLLELLDGWIVHKTTKNPPHDGTVDEINRLISAVLPAGWYVRTQNLLLTPDSAPEPDAVIVSGVPRDYMNQHPVAGDAALVIEVADSSLARDRLKARIYARAGVAIYWIVNLIDSQIEVYSDLAGSGRDAAYRLETVFRGDAAVTVSIAGLEISFRADQLLP